MSLGSGIRFKPIPDPDQGVKKALNPGSRIRIRNTVKDKCVPVQGSAVTVGSSGTCLGDKRVLKSNKLLVQREKTDRPVVGSIADS